MLRGERGLVSQRAADRPSRGGHRCSLGVGKPPKPKQASVRTTGPTARNYWWAVRYKHPPKGALDRRRGIQSDTASRGLELLLVGLTPPPLTQPPTGTVGAITSQGAALVGPWRVQTPASAEGVTGSQHPELAQQSFRLGA